MQPLQEKEGGYKPKMMMWKTQIDEAPSVSCHNYTRVEREDRSFLYICSDKSLVPATADSLSWKEPGMQEEVKVPPGTLRGKGMLLLPGSASDTPDNNSSEGRWWVASVLGQPAFVSDPW